jgi:hypothetical protein
MAGAGCGGGGKQYPYIEGSEPSGGCAKHEDTEETAVYEQPEQPEDEVVIPSSPADDYTPAPAPSAPTPEQ